MIGPNAAGPTRNDNKESKEARETYGSKKKKFDMATGGKTELDDQLMACIEFFQVPSLSELTLLAEEERTKSIKYKGRPD